MATPTVLEQDMQKIIDQIEFVKSLILTIPHTDEDDEQACRDSLYNKYDRLSFMLQEAKDLYIDCLG